MGKVSVRDVNPFLQIIRNLLFGRKHTLAVRFSPEVASRTPPLPQLPDGPSHRLFANYYYTRDGRSEVKPPLELTGTQAKIAAGKPELPKTGSLRTPGPVFHWD